MWPLGRDGILDTARCEEARLLGQQELQAEGSEAQPRLAQELSP